MSQWANEFPVRRDNVDCSRNGTVQCPIHRGRRCSSDPHQHCTFVSRLLKLFEEISWSTRKKNFPLDDDHLRYECWLPQLLLLIELLEGSLVDWQSVSVEGASVHIHRIPDSPWMECSSVFDRTRLRNNHSIRDELEDSQSITMNECRKNRLTVFRFLSDNVIEEESKTKLLFGIGAMSNKATFEEHLKRTYLSMYLLRSFLLGISSLLFLHSWYLRCARWTTKSLR